MKSRSQKWCSLGIPLTLQLKQRSLSPTHSFWMWRACSGSGDLHLYPVFLVTLILPVQEVLQRQTQRIQPVRGALSGAKHLTGLSLIKCLLTQLLTQPLSSEPQLLLPGFLVIRRSCRYFHGSSGSGFVCTSFQITEENEAEGICRSNQL